MSGGNSLLQNLDYKNLSLIHIYLYPNNNEHKLILDGLIIHVEPIFPELREKIKRAMKALKGLDYDAEEVSAREFYDFMTGEIFSEDKTTLRDVLDSDYLMIHELVEISELKKMGRRIDRRVVVNSPRTVIYEAHLFAMEFEMDYALKRGDLA